MTAFDPNSILSTPETMPLVHGETASTSPETTLSKVWQPWNDNAISRLVDNCSYDLIGDKEPSSSAPSLGSASLSDASPPTFAPVNAVSANVSPKKRPATDLCDDDAGSSILSAEAEKVNKRQRNTEAARRYRQRKVDRLTEVEDALAQMTKERDNLRVELARSQAEADVLRRMVKG